MRAQRRLVLQRRGLLAQGWGRLVLQRRGLLAQAQRVVLQGQLSPQWRAQGWGLLAQAQQQAALWMERNQWLRAPLHRRLPRHPYAHPPAMLGALTTQR